MNIVLQFLSLDDELVFQIRLVSKQFFYLIHQDQFLNLWLSRIDPRTQKLKDPYCIRIPNGNIIGRHGWAAFDNEEYNYTFKPVVHYKGRRLNALNPLSFRTLRSLFLLNLYQMDLNDQDIKNMNCYYHEFRFIRDGVMNFNLMIDDETNKKEFVIYLEFHILYFIKNLHLQKLSLKINVFFNYQLVRIFNILFDDNYRILRNFGRVNSKNRFLITSAISTEEKQHIFHTLIRQRFGRPDLNQGNHFVSEYKYIEQLQEELKDIPNPKRQRLV